MKPQQRHYLHLFNHPSRRRSNSQNSRGPQRRLWEPKHSKSSSQPKVLMVLFISCIAMMTLYQKSTPSSSSSSSLSTSNKGAQLVIRRSFRGQHKGESQVTELNTRANILLSRGETHTIQNDAFSNRLHVASSGGLVVPDDVDAADAIVVGSGLAGLTTALQLLDRGGKVYIVEKEAILGGNSNKASSGINGCCWDASQGDTRTGGISNYNPATNDTLALFFQDTVQSAGDVANEKLIHTLVNNSAETLQWIQNRVNIDLSAPLVLLGGHSRRRTHRPPLGFIGAELMTAMEIEIRKYEEKGLVSVLLEHRVTRILEDKERMIAGVQIENQNEPTSLKNLYSRNVVLATGGFASDRSEGSLLQKYRPELQNMAATAGIFSTGDGIHLAKNMGATTRDMEKIQIHPTGFVDPSRPNNPQKVLAAELLRGVGGILINSDGHRFANELGTRSYLSGKMFEHNAAYHKSRLWDPDLKLSTFHILLSSAAAKEAQRHVDTYMRKGLILKYKGIKNLAQELGISEERLVATIRAYQLAAIDSRDEFGKTSFQNIFKKDLDSEVFYVGTVTPVLHYCMGGVKINEIGEVLSEDDLKIEGLYAVGEVTGGVHGQNRLGGNSLLECAVYGRIVGTHIKIQSQSEQFLTQQRNKEASKAAIPSTVFKSSDLLLHNNDTDCYVSIYGVVYDLTNFLVHHPGGAESISSLCGFDGTSFFQVSHSKSILVKLENHVVGHLAENPQSGFDSIVDQTDLRAISLQELKTHSSIEDCWVVIHGKVYNMTKFSLVHKGGAYAIQKLAGTDATKVYSVFHSVEKLNQIDNLVMGQFLESESKI